MEILEQIESTEAICVYFKGEACGVCTVLEPKVKEMIETKFPEMKFVSVEANSNEDLISHYRILSAPVMLVFFDGRETIRKGGNVSLSEFSDEIQRYYKLYFE